MNNDKWLCTVHVFENKDGTNSLSLVGPEGQEDSATTRIFLLAAEAFKVKLAKSAGINPYPSIYPTAPNEAPTEPQDT